MAVAGDHFYGDKENIGWQNFPLRNQIALEEWPIPGALSSTPGSGEDCAELYLPFLHPCDHFCSDTPQSCLLHTPFSAPISVFIQSKSIGLGFTP